MCDILLIKYNMYIFYYMQYIKYIIYIHIYWIYYLYIYIYNLYNNIYIYNLYNNIYIYTYYMYMEWGTLFLDKPKWKTSTTIGTITSVCDLEQTIAPLVIQHGNWESSLSGKTICKGGLLPCLPTSVRTLHKNQNHKKATTTMPGGYWKRVWKASHTSWKLPMS